jgi:endoglucanase
MVTSSNESRRWRCRARSRRAALDARLALALVAALAAGSAACGALFPTDNRKPPPTNEWIAYSVVLDTVGFLPDRAKRATVDPGTATLTDTSFEVRSKADDTMVFSGTLAAPAVDPDTGVSLLVADFTALTQPGDYYVYVPGLGPNDPGKDKSPPFTIGANVFNAAFSTAMLGLTGARCGAALSMSYGGDDFSHKACHGKDAYTDYILPGTSDLRPSPKGWHDAGDYGKYSTNGAFSVGMLLAAWEQFQPVLEPIALQVPEHGGPLPDFLAEVKWELDWLHTAQIDDGSVAHKVTALHFGGESGKPENDGDKRYYAPVGSVATADFTAVMAQAARIYRPYDATFADQCLADAQKAYAFLTANHELIVPDQSAFTTGTYNDNTDGDDRLWAAAEMWETTGDAAALADFESNPSKVAADTGSFDWPHAANLGFYTYALSQRDGRDATRLAAVQAALVAAGDAVAMTSSAHLYGRGIHDYYWGTNGVVVRNAMNLWAANTLAPDPKYLDAIHAQVDYILGRNPFGRSLVTGIGYHPPLKPHHGPSSSDNIFNPYPGMLVGGGQTKGGLDWMDTDNYTTNEVAINWTAAFVYAVAALAR